MMFVKGDHEVVEKALAAQEKRHVCPGKAHRDGEAQADFSDQNLDVVNTSLNGAHFAPRDTSQDTWLTASPALIE
jgi:hypothetical protein